MLSEILKYPEVMAACRGKRKLALNTIGAVCLSDSPTVRHFKEKEEEKRVAEERRQGKKKGRKKSVKGTSY